MILIGRTLTQASAFNEVVRSQVAAMNIGERYNTITESFNSIRDDAKSMVDQLDDGTGTPTDPDRFVKDLADALADMVSDPDRARALGEVGRLSAEQEFSWLAIAERTLALYDEVLAG